MESQLEEINEVRKDEQLVLPDNLDYMRYNMSWCVSNSLGLFFNQTTAFSKFLYSRIQVHCIIEKFYFI